MLIMAFIVPGLFTWSFGIADVSTVPGRAWAKTWYSMVSWDMPEPRIWETRAYWLPTVPEMFSHLG